MSQTMPKQFRIYMQTETMRKPLPVDFNLSQPATDLHKASVFDERDAFKALVEIQRLNPKVTFEMRQVFTSLLLN